MVVFEEIPDEVTLAINITNCPCKCKGCHSKFLWDNVGIDLTFDELDRLIEKDKGITCVCFMGGDREPKYIDDLANHIRNSHKDIKVGWYSGNDSISNDIDKLNFDYIKVGHYDEEKGALNKETTNQRMFKFMEDGVADITYRFWKRK